MEFCSGYVYVYDSPDYEYISAEEYEDGMNLSCSNSDDSDSPTEGPGVGYEPSSPSYSPSSPEIMGGGALLSHETLDRNADSPPQRRKRRVLKKKLNHHWRTGGKGAQDTAPPDPHNHRRVRQGDTNVITVKFDKLISPSNMHAGDAQSCTQCGAILSALSKLSPEGDQKIWSCEFCDTRNVLDIEDEEKPKDTDVTFMLEPALSTSASGPTGLDESLVVFCVDVSGSMCVTTEVPGHVELRGAQGLRRAQLLNRERSNQFLPNQRRDVTYVSRLQSVQAAIDHQLQEMVKDFPNRRVALISFNNEVTVFGDGKVDPLSIAGDKLTDKDTLKKIASEQPFPDSIKNTRQQLGKKLFEMEECGPTALGPALLVASTMAAKVRGSKIILCTDGLANVGMGKLDNFKSDQEKDDSIAFYEQVSDAAVENGVSISVVTIKGTDCKLVEIGKMADKTGGQVNIVDPLKLTQEFSTILANKIIATNVEATFILHKQLFFFYEDSEDSKVVKNIGNVTVDSEISFEYGVRTNSVEGKKKNPGIPENIIEVDEPAESEKVEAMDTDELTANSKDSAEANPANPTTSTCSTENPEDKKDSPSVPSGSSETEHKMAEGAECPLGQNDKTEVPFQLQIVYTDTEGAKALRVITQSKPITRDRRKAEQSAKIDVLARHTAMNTAKMAQDGLYTMCRERALMNQRVAWRHSRENNDADSRPTYKKKFGKIKKMENYLNLRQKSERATRGRTYSDSEGDDDDDEDDYEACSVGASDCPKPTLGGKGKGKSKSFLSKLKKKRSETTDDAGAALVFKGKSAKSFFEDSD